MDDMENNNLEQTPQEPQVTQVSQVSPVAQTTPKKGMAIASMVLGIASIVISCAWYLSIPCGIIAIVLSVLANKAEKTGMAKAGLIMGIVGIGLSIILLTLLASFLASFNSANMSQ